MLARWIVLLSSVLHLAQSEAVYKKWLPDTNYNNPDNWDTATVPCENDIIHFSDGKGNAPVFIQSNISTRSLVLPVNGELVLEDNVMIAFPTEHSNQADCPGKDVHFVGAVARAWMDPDNWCEATSPGFHCLTNQPPRLDTERVPCQHDNIIFPKHGSLNLDLEGVDVSVGSLTITDQPPESKAYLDTIKQWSVTGSLTVQQRSCDDDPAGCPCGNDHAQLQAAICAHQSPRCPPTPCVSPIEVQGHCCHICGAKMELEYAADFRFSTLYNALKYQYGQDRNYESVTFVMTLSSAGHVVVVLWDDEGGHAAENIARTLALFVKQDKDGPQKYGITEVRFYSSAGDGPSAGALTGGSGGSSLSTGSIAGIILSIGLLIVILIVCLICFVDRSQCRRLNHMIPRFKKREDEEQLDGSMELATASPKVKEVSFAQLSADLPSIPQGFDNPMYGSPITLSEREESGLDANANAPTTEIDLSDVAPEDVTFSTDKTLAGGHTAFDNPLYGTSKKQAADEKSGEGSKDEGFSNPMYQENGKSDLMYQGSTLKLNPVYSEDGVEDESNI